VVKDAFDRTGEQPCVRYHLTISLRPVSAVTIDATGDIVATTPTSGG
jgi:hypothetical protein